MAFHLRAGDSLLTVVFGSPSPHQLKKKKKDVVKVGPPLTKLSGSAHGIEMTINITILTFPAPHDVPSAAGRNLVSHLLLPR